VLLFNNTIEMGKMQKMTEKNKSGFNLINLLIRFQRFSGDLLGILLISIGLLSYLGLFRLSQGFLIDQWTMVIEKGLGWGAYLATGLVIYIGIIILVRRLEKAPHLNMNRLLALEGFVFFSLILLSIFGGFSLERAELGEDGGVVGWGLSRIVERILPVPLSTILLFIFSVIFLLNGIGLGQTLINRFRMRLNRENESISNSFRSEMEDLSDKNRQSNSAVELSLRKDNEYKFSSQATKSTSARKTNTKNLPPMDLLLTGEAAHINKEFLQIQAKQIIKTLSEFDVPAKVTGYRVGPSIIQYAIELGSYDKVDENGNLVHKRVQMQQLIRLKKDLTLSLAVERLRFETPIPGFSYIGIEVPNQQGSKVRIRPILESSDFQNLKSPLGLILGVDVSNHPVLADLTRMPHLLIGGTTGSGKSIFIRDLVVSLIMRNTPENLRLILLDPKKVELAPFEGIPHLLGPIETDPKRMIAALQWSVLEMERRFKLMESYNARDLNSFNLKMKDRGEETLPRIVIIIDELAYLMANEPDQAEAAIARLSQMARATGIHLVVSTQRPSVNVVTGLIKANFPARIALVTATSVDSKVILDKAGAEDLLGKGDLLFLNPEQTDLQRAQAPMVEKQEISNVVNYWINQGTSDLNAAPWEEIASQENEISDDLLQKAIKVVQEEGRASASLLQLRLHIGFPRAGHLMDELKEKGYIGSSEFGGKERQVNLPRDVNRDETD
jgi:S-DNA-T family DNA segregation ATPase FtsK/SpoIIIE